MILTVTLNPSVDISYPLETLKIDTVNRVKDVSKTAGGKGLNVTRVLYESGDKVTATGFLGGKIGEFIESELEQSPVSPAFYSNQKLSQFQEVCLQDFPTIIMKNLSNLLRMKE